MTCVVGMRHQIDSLLTYCDLLGFFFFFSFSCFFLNLSMISDGKIFWETEYVFVYHQWKWPSRSPILYVMFDPIDPQKAHERDPIDSRKTNKRDPIDPWKTHDRDWLTRERTTSETRVICERIHTHYRDPIENWPMNETRLFRKIDPIVPQNTHDYSPIDP